MRVILSGLGKKYINQWIFRDINYKIEAAHPIAITGPNGSGKSTLLRILSGWMLPSKGSVIYERNGVSIPEEKIYHHIDFIAPYTELLEELTLDEFLRFHFSFKTMNDNLSLSELPDKINLSGERNKEIRNFSSGMKQRLKLGISFYSNTSVLLLDEPTTNLDDENKKWFFNQIEQISAEKIIVIASNQEEEIAITDSQIFIPNYNSN